VETESGCFSTSTFMKETTLRRAHL